MAQGDTVTARSAAKRQRGRMAYHAGIAAENRIAQDYERRGFAIARRRWRGRAGEIDLILRDGAALIFVEVKQSRSFARAAESVIATDAAYLPLCRRISCWRTRRQPDRSAV